MKSLRPVSIALVMGAMVIALAGCGKSSSVVSPAGVSLDTTPPAAPTNVAGSYDPAGQRDYVSWTASTSPDVAGYEVWQYASDPALGATGTMIASTEAGTETVALPLTNEAQPAWFRIRATDQAGNISAYSATAQHDLHAWESQTNPSGGPIRVGGI